MLLTLILHTFALIIYCGRIIMEWYIYPAVIAAGFAAGFINTIAFSGSLITLPLLIFLGLPANVANGTNRVAILLQTLVGTGTFKQAQKLDIRRGIYLAIPAIAGAIVGAQIAVNLDEEMMRRTIGILMIAMLVIILFKPNRWLEGQPELAGRKLNFIQVLTFFGVGVYGGFIQAGVGIFVLAGLVLAAGYDLVHGNAIKNLIILCFTIFALIIFVINDQVDWFIGLILAAGNMLGAWIAAKMAIKKGTSFVRWILIVILIVSAAVLLGLNKTIGRLF